MLSRCPKRVPAGGALQQSGHTTMHCQVSQKGSPCYVKLTQGTYFSSWSRFLMPCCALLRAYKAARLVALVRDTTEGCSKTRPRILFDTIYGTSSSSPGCADYLGRCIILLPALAYGWRWRKATHIGPSMIN